MGKILGGRTEGFHAMVRDFTQPVFGPRIAKDSLSYAKVDVTMEVHSRHFFLGLLQCRVLHLDPVSRHASSMVAVPPSASGSGGRHG